MRYGDQHSTSMSMYVAISWRETHRRSGFHAASMDVSSSVPGRYIVPPRSPASTQTNRDTMGTACPMERSNVSASVTGEASIAQLS